MRIITTVVAAIVVVTSYGQDTRTNLSHIDNNPNWVTVSGDISVAPQAFFVRFNEELGLSPSDEMRLRQESSDALGFTHSRYDQYRNGFRVDGAQFILHTKDAQVRSGNGRLVRNILGNTGWSVTSQQAISAAMTRIGARAYLFESEVAEAQLKRIRNNPNATYFPSPELVWFDKTFSQDGSMYKLVWKVELNTMDPLGRFDVYVDAATGEVAHVISKNHHADVPGTAVTKYSGTHNIITDSVAPGQYRLREASRGNGIETYNMQQGINYNLAVDFTDSDNFWNNVNPQQDEAATDAHWGMEMTYDYYLTAHGRNGLNDSGMTMISYLHYDQNYANAFWNGSFMTFGDGSGSYTAFTALDIVAHEATHGVTEFSASLIYQNEPGALNESFSDIFGEAVQFWATPAKGDWLVGADAHTGGTPLRSMSDPKQQGDPDTYFGINWVTGPFDNGGVHTNSGVQNYWFYLLSAGGTGVNDLGHNYTVTGVGLDTAAAIAYRNLTTYLTPSSQYTDARLGAIQSAEDLYAACSDAVVQTSAAWFAVGVGFTIQDNDLWAVGLLSPQTACGLSSAEPVTARLRYNGCAGALNIGDTVPLGYRLDGGAAVYDTLVLSSVINGGDTIDFTFTQSADLSIVGAHAIDVWSSFGSDPQPLNDTLRGIEVVHILQQNVDMGVVEIVSPTSSCHLGNAEDVELLLQFFGCDSLPAGATIEIGYRVNGGASVTSNFALTSTAYPGVPFSATVTGPANLSAYGKYTMDAWTAFAPDFIKSNDTLFDQVVQKPFDVAGRKIGFEHATAVLDSFYEISGAHAEARTHATAASSGARGLRMTGGDVLSVLDDIEGIPDGTNNFDINADFRAKVCFCVDATTWPSAFLQFDLKQVYSPVYELYLGDPIPDASSFRILVDNNQVGPIYTPTTTTMDPFVTHQVDLTAYAGSEFELCLQSQCYFHPSFDPTTPLGQGDQAKVDNVIVSPQPVTKVDVPATPIRVYPNPNSGTFTVTSTRPGVVHVEDLLGRLVMTTEVVAGANEVSIPSAASGLFLVRVLNSQGETSAAMPVVIE